MSDMEKCVTATIYTKDFCGYCSRALALLRSKDVNVNEIDVSNEPERRAEMIQRTNGERTLPQIFIGDRHIGGCDELHDLEEAGQLDQMLEAV